VDVFDLRQRLVDDYADFTRSFVNIRDERIAAHVDHELGEGLWPEPIVQLNPAFEAGGTVDELVTNGILDERCAAIFRRQRPSRISRASRFCCTVNHGPRVPRPIAGQEVSSDSVGFEVDETVLRLRDETVAIVPGPGVEGARL
jgi:hypothetical protein